MTLDEAVLYYKNLSEIRRIKAENSLFPKALMLHKEANQYFQLASWLDELRDYKEVGTVQGYKDAIKAYTNEYNLRKELSDELRKYS